MSNARLEKQYKEQIRPELQKELGLSNIMEVPKVSKIVLNIGVSDGRLSKISDVLARIAGQQPIQTRAKKSIAGFKIREGMPLGLKVTLRENRMYEFFDKLINLALPKVKDFQGLKTRFDGFGNYNLGIKEWSIFPEVDTAAEEIAAGLNVTIHTSTKSDEQGLALLKSFGMPYRKSKTS